MNTIKRQKTVYFPKQLKNKVEHLAATTTQKNKFFHIIDLIATKSRQEHSVDTEFVPLSRNYFIEVLGYRYTDITSSLLNADIIISNNSYNVERHKCKEYKLNSKLYHTHKYDKIVFKYSVPKVWKDENVSKKIRNTESYHKEHRKTLESFILDKDYLYTVADKVLQDALNRPLPKRKAKTERTMLTYITAKKYHLYANIENICNKSSLYAARSRNNYRLNNNFTNMSKDLRQAIFDANDFISIDLKSSQYSILLKILKDNNVTGDDVDLFEHLIITGQLYEYICNNSSEYSRNDAKDFMMNVAFGRHYFITERKKKFAELFPTISKYLNTWKAKNGYKEVPLALQRIESDLFIDRIKTDLCTAGIVNTTCHDSVAVHVSNEDQAIDIMLKHFTDAGLQGKVKNENTSEIIAI